MTKLKGALNNYIAKLKPLVADQSLLLKSSGQAFLIKIISLALSFVMQIMLARILGTTEYGLYIYVLAWINSLTLLAKLGLDQAAKKFIPLYQIEDDNNNLFGFIRFSAGRVFLFSILLSLIIIAWAWLEYHPAENQLFKVFALGSAVLILNAQLHLSGGILEAMKKIVTGLAPLHILRPVLIMAGLGIIFFLRANTADSAMLLNIIATLSVLVVSFYFLKKPFTNKPLVKVKADKQWLKIAAPLLFSSGIHLLLTQTDVILIGILIDTNEAGIYNSASKISQLVVFGLTAVNVITAPLISEYYHKKDMAGLQKMVSSSAFLTALLTIPLIVIIALFAPFGLKMFGGDFLAGTSSLRILLIGQLVNGFTGSIGYLMTMTKYHKQSLYILLVSALLNVILNVTFIPILGIEGAAYASMFTTILWNIGMYIFVKKNLNIDSSFIGLFNSKNDE